MRSDQGIDPFNRLEWSCSKFSLVSFVQIRDWAGQLVVSESQAPQFFESSQIRD